jgi:hypothetical protein
MKAKILKKARKRYKWYYSHKGDIMCIDIFKEELMIIDKEFLMKYYGNSEEFVNNVPCGFKEYAFRTLKTIMFGEYGWSFSRWLYRKAYRSAMQGERLKIKRRKLN